MESKPITSKEVITVGMFVASIFALGLFCGWASFGSHDSDETIPLPKQNPEELSSGIPDLALSSDEWAKHGGDLHDAIVASHNDEFVNRRGFRPSYTGTLTSIEQVPGTQYEMLHFENGDTFECDIGNFVVRIGAEQTFHFNYDEATKNTLIKEVVIAGEENVVVSEGTYPLSHFRQYTNLQISQLKNPLYIRDVGHVISVEPKGKTLAETRIKIVDGGTVWATSPVDVASQLQPDDTVEVYGKVTGILDNAVECEAVSIKRFE